MSNQNQEPSPESTLKSIFWGVILGLIICAMIYVAAEWGQAFN